MDKLTLAICTVGFVAVFLPTAFAGGFYCMSCPLDPLTSVPQCNASSTSKSCGADPSGFTCYGATVELNNGTFVGIKDCFLGNDCNSTTACARAQNATGVSFKRCVAECCGKTRCNLYLPAPLPPPSSSVPASASVGVNVTTQTPSTAIPDPTSAGTTTQLSLYAAIFLLVAMI